VAAGRAVRRPAAGIRRGRPRRCQRGYPGRGEILLTRAEGRARTAAG